MNFISLCSGIEAASVAFGPLGWKAIAFSEIEPFPSAVLAYHYPTVRNYGDMSLFREWPEEVFAFADAVVGGPPCQAFSVAGARRGLADARGNLTLIYVELLNHADAIRKKYGKPPVVALYENVPGIFSDKTNAFGCLVGGLAGEDVPAIPPGKRWTDAGCVFGPERAVAWRLLDAQFFALAQRRRRVFVVASARTGFDPAQVLFEWDGVRRDSAPSREAGERVAACLGSCPAASSQPNVGNGQGNVVEVHAFDAFNQEATGQVSKTIAARNDQDTASIIATGRPDTVGTLCADSHPGSYTGQDAYTGRLIPAVAVPVAFAIQAGALRTNPLSGPDGIGVQADHAYTLEARAEVQAVAQPVAFHPTQDPISSTDGSTHALGCGSTGGQASVAVALRGREGVATAELGDEVQNCLRASSGGGDKPHVLTAMQVRRLTPEECEALQGFPRSYTAIPWRGKPPEQCPDGPRYKALGNSWAVPNVTWIGRRIQAALLNS